MKASRKYEGSNQRLHRHSNCEYGRSDTRQGYSTPGTAPTRPERSQGIRVLPGGGPTRSYSRLYSEGRHETGGLRVEVYIRTSGKSMSNRSRRFVGGNPYWRESKRKLQLCSSSSPQAEVIPVISAEFSHDYRTESRASDSEKPSAGDRSYSAQWVIATWIGTIRVWGSTSY